MTFFKSGLLLLTALLATACSDNEAPPAEDHIPVSYSIQVNDAPVSTYTFVTGETVRVRIKFFNAAQEDLDEVEDSHFGGLTFQPTSLASVVRVPDHNYQFDVTWGSPGSGTLQVSYGHDEAADEHTLPTAAVTVTPGGGGPAPTR
ncbi:MAG TPA: hypothetical protein VFZ87_08240 [Gemmatimonadales bacterium]